MKDEFVETLELLFEEFRQAFPDDRWRIQQSIDNTVHDMIEGHTELNTGDQRRADWEEFHRFPLEYLRADPEERAKWVTAALRWARDEVQRNIGYAEVLRVRDILKARLRELEETKQQLDTVRQQLADARKTATKAAREWEREGEQLRRDIQRLQEERGRARNLLDEKVDIITSLNDEIRQLQAENIAAVQKPAEVSKDSGDFEPAWSGYWYGRAEWERQLAKHQAKLRGSLMSYVEVPSPETFDSIIKRIEKVIQLRSGLGRDEQLVTNWGELRNLLTTASIPMSERIADAESWVELEGERNIKAASEARGNQAGGWVEVRPNENYRREELPRMLAAQLERNETLEKQLRQQSLDRHQVLDEHDAMKSRKSLNEWRDEVHLNAKNKGFWDAPFPTFGDKLALIHSEVSEALEEFRKGHAPDETYYSVKSDGSQDFPPFSYNGPMGEEFEQATAQWLESVPERFRKPEGIPSELVDVIIRVLDLCGWYGIDVDAMMEMKTKHNASRERMHGKTM